MAIRIAMEQSNKEYLVKKTTPEGRIVDVDILAFILLPDQGYQPLYAGQLTISTDSNVAQSVQQGMNELLQDFKRVKKENFSPNDQDASICRPYLGFKYDLAKFKDTNKYIVSRVLPGSPVAKSGIKVGDELLLADGLSMKEFSDQNGVSKAYKKNTSSKVVINRNGKAMNIAVKPVYKCLK